MNHGVHHRTGNKGDPDVGSSLFHIADTVLRHFRHQVGRISRLLSPRSPTGIHIPKSAFASISLSGKFK